MKIAFSSRWACRLLCWAGVAFALSGCREKTTPPAGGASSGSAPLARVNDRVLTEADLRFEVQRRLAAGQPVGSPEAVVNDLVERELMLQAARKSDWINDPAVRRDLENQLLTRWLDHTLQRDKDQVKVTDEELKTIYDSRPDDYKKPALVRLAILYRKSSPHDSEETRASLKAGLESGKADFLRNPAGARQDGRVPGFGAVAATHSEDALTRYRGGDVGWLDLSRTGHRLPAAVTAAGAALAVGAVSDVLSTDTGLYVVMKTDARPAHVTPFEEVVASLRRRVLKQRQDEVAAGFKRGLLAGNRIEINRDAAARLTLPQAPQTAAKGRLPGPQSASEFNVSLTAPLP